MDIGFSQYSGEAATGPRVVIPTAGSPKFGGARSGGGEVSLCKAGFVAETKQCYGAWVARYAVFA